MLLLFLSAAWASGTWTVDIPTSVGLGEPITVVVTVTNNTSDDLALPEDALSRLAITADYTHPNERRALHGQGFAKPAPVPASSVSWTHIQPGKSLSRSVELAPPEGAHVGGYLVKVFGAPRVFSGAPAGADQTFVNESESFTVESPAQAAHSFEHPAVVQSARLVQRELVLDIVVTNVGERPFWVPTTYLEQCRAEALARPENTGFGSGMGIGGQPAIMHEPMLTLLQTGDEQHVEVNCGTVPPRSRAIAATVSLEPQAPQVPVLPSSPQTVLGASLTIGPFLADPRRLPKD